MYIADKGGDKRSSDDMEPDVIVVVYIVGSWVSLAKSSLGVWRLLHLARRGLVVSKNLIQTSAVQQSLLV